MKGMMSWEQLIFYVFVFLIVYYILVLLIFYGRTLVGRSHGPHNTNPRSRPFENVNTSLLRKTDKTTLQEDTIYTQVMELMEDLKPVFKAAVDDKPGTSQIITALRLRVQRYPGIKGSSFQSAITTHIEQTLQQSTGLLLSAEDISQVW